MVSNTDPDVARLMAFVRRPYRMLGLDVLDPTWKISVLTLFSAFIFIMQQLAAVKFLVTHLDSFDIASECLALSAIGCEITLRMILLLYFRDMLRDTVDAVSNQNDLFRNSESFKRLSKEFCQVAFRSVRAVGLIYSSTATFQLIPIFFPDPRKNNLPLAFSLPFIPSDVAPYWHVNYVFDVFVNVMGILFMVGSDGMLIMCILAVVYQIKGLKQSLQELDTGAEPEHLRQELAYLVRTHMAIKRFMSQMEQKYKFDLLILFGLVSIVLCMGMNVIADNICQPFTLFLTAATFQLALLCFGGNLLLIESDSLADYMYSIDWSVMPVSEQKTLMVMIAHAQPPMAMNAIFMPLAMSSFISVMKASYSYYTILH
ncbi:odorant receptor 22c-like [Anopheles nili]|uniref:odorant receptor 22c-like n=1 Tax=Anopheles nili TaxID=185578 RepID=UPI00237A91BA|nr:odorant receptor 22c-like [Anopheles nili]